MKALLNTTRTRCARLANGFKYHRQVQRAGGWIRLWLDELVGILPAPVRKRLLAGARAQCLRWPLPFEVTPGSAKLVLPSAEVMAQTISLPATATADLQRVLAFELDRYTPFTAEQVHFTARVTQRTAERVSVLLVVVERERLMMMIGHCQEQGLALQAIDAEDVHGHVMGIDLLPPNGARRPHGPHGCSACCCWAVPY